MITDLLAAHLSLESRQRALQLWQLALMRLAACRIRCIHAELGLLGLCDAYAGQAVEDLHSHISLPPLTQMHLADAALPDLLLQHLRRASQVLSHYGECGCSTTAAGVSTLAGFFMVQWGGIASRPAAYQLFERDGPCAAQGVQAGGPEVGVKAGGCAAGVQGLSVTHIGHLCQGAWHRRDWTQGPTLFGLIC